MISKADRNAIAARHPNIPQDGFPEMDAVAAEAPRRLTPEEAAGIYDLTHGQCKAGLILRGAYFRCCLAPKHDGWAHQNAQAEAVWDAGSD